VRDATVAMLIAEQLTKYYGARAAISDLNFSIQPGEAVGLLGLNGAGKTTALRILCGLLLPTCGRVEIDGVDMIRNPDILRAKTGFLPESPPLYGEMAVRGYLEFVAHIKGVRGDVCPLVERALHAADLQEVRDERIDTLSFGFARRVGIAQAVVHQPSLILLDEPTAGLDPVQIVHMRQLIRSLRNEHTVIVSSHLLHEIHEVCDRIFVLQDGRIVAQGTEDDLAGRLGRHLNVRVEVHAQPAALAQVLGGLHSVKGHTIEREHDGATTAVIHMESDVREDLAKLLVGAGLGLRRLERVRPELESIFLKLTGGDDRSADGDRES
jgi:ABC-2 type transport system ATP-binding protein